MLLLIIIIILKFSNYHNQHNLLLFIHSFIIPGRRRVRVEQSASHSDITVITANI